MKAIEWADKVPARVHGYTRSQFVHALRSLLRKNGVSYGNAIYDEAGNCKVCDECGRCPGVHTLDELKK